MKNFIYIFILAALAASCTNTIELDIKLPEKRLILNSFLRTDNDLQVIYLSERTDRRGQDAMDGIENVYGAEVKCFVNGELVAVAEELIKNQQYAKTKTSPADPYTGPFGVCHYWFRASFKPGDKVRIEAQKDDRKVYAEIVVPEPPELEFVEMKQYTDKVSEWTSYEMLDIDFKIKDIAGKDTYYRIGNASRHMDILFHFHDKEGNKTGEDMVSEYEDAPELSIENDPILNDGYMPGTSDDIFSELNPANTFRVFTDNQFKDKSAKVGLTLDITVDKSRIFSQSEYTSKEADVKPTLKINVETLDFMTYNYYKALNAGAAFGYDISFLMEPIIFPSNVVGGLGFVGISTTTTLEVTLPPLSFEWDPIIYS